MRSVLVTGADGFIGSHLVTALARQGAVVTALAAYNSFDSHGWLDEVDPALRAGMTLVRGDIRDADQMMALCRGQEVVFHLAALIAIPFSYAAPSSYVQTNVQGTLNLLSAARAAGVRRFVHTSTSEVYGTARFTPITEDHPLQGQSPYSASKIGADMMAESFARSFGTPVITLRPFNTYGPRQSERAVISTVIRQALDPACAAIRVGDLTPTRDFNFVEDTAAAFMAVASLGDEHAGAVFNAGTGVHVSIGTMVEMVRELTGCTKKLEVEEHRKRPANSEVFTLLADASRLTAASGWRPQVDLREGLRRTIEWWRPRLDRLRPDLGYMT
jgi:UDP-glucose 4-epimerase